MTARTGSTSHRVAILSEPGILRDLALRVVRDIGWSAELIDDRDLDTTTPPPWSLVILADSADNPSDLARRGLMASRHPHTRVLAMAMERDPQRVADALNSGVDDYLVAPFDLKEFRARMLALVCRSRQAGDRRKFSLAFDFTRRTIVSGPMFVALPPREWDTLIALLEAEGRAVPPEEIERLIWEDAVSHQTVPSVIARIRRRFDEREFRVIQINTVRGQGYQAVFRRATDSLPQDR